MMLNASVILLIVYNAACPNKVYCAECHYAECRGNQWEIRLNILTSRLVDWQTGRLVDW
jgi:hypothetical protein